MKYILDSSVAFKWVVPEVLSDKAIQLRDDAGQGIYEFFAPDFFPIEIAHAITRAERQGRIPVGGGWALWQSVMADGPILCSSLPLLARAYVISSAARIGVYDCVYVALAEREQCELVTPDDRLVQNLHTSFPFVKHLSTLP
jgi:predicted nucleic acid-binding protein